MSDVYVSTTADSAGSAVLIPSINAAVMVRELVTEASYEREGPRAQLQLHPAGELRAHPLRIVATDGRHVQQIVAPRTRRGSVPVIGFGDGITVTVVGLAEDGTRGPAVKASARQVLPKKPKPRRRKSRH